MVIALLHTETFPRKKWLHQFSEDNYNSHVWILSSPNSLLMCNGFEYLMCCVKIVIRINECICVKHGVLFDLSYCSLCKVQIAIEVRRKSWHSHWSKKMTKTLFIVIVHGWRNGWNEFSWLNWCVYKARLLDRL